MSTFGSIILMELQFHKIIFRGYNLIKRAINRGIHRWFVFEKNKCTRPICVQFYTNLTLFLLCLLPTY